MEYFFIVSEKLYYTVDLFLLLLLLLLLLLFLLLLYIYKSHQGKERGLTAHVFLTVE